MGVGGWWGHRVDTVGLCVWGKSERMGQNALQFGLHLDVKGQNYPKLLSFNGKNSLNVKARPY